MLIAHITDTHITAPGTLLMGIVDTASALERAVAAINRLDPSPDAAVLTGDLVENGAPAEYAHLRALVAPLRMPMFAIPGNHDAREPMREAFIGDGYLPRQGFLDFAIEEPVAHHRARYFGAGRGRRGSVFGAAAVDRSRPLGGAGPTYFSADASSAISDRNPPDGPGRARRQRRLRRGDSGSPPSRAHPLRASSSSDRKPLAGTVAGTAPSTAHQIVLDLHPKARLSFAFEPPGYQLHYWREGIGLVTHTATIGDWPGPYFYSKKLATDCS